MPHGGVRSCVWKFVGIFVNFCPKCSVSVYDKRCTLEGRSDPQSADIHVNINTSLHRTAIPLSAAFKS